MSTPDAREGTLASCGVFSSTVQQDGGEGQEHFWEVPRQKNEEPLKDGEIGKQEEADQALAVNFEIKLLILGNYSAEISPL